MKRLFAMLIFATLLVANPELTRANTDSIGTLTLDDQTFILYQVAAGETLFGISRKYGLKVEDILAVNPYVVNNSINEGQILKIPLRLFKPDKAVNHEETTMVEQPQNEKPQNKSQQETNGEIRNSGDELNQVAEPVNSDDVVSLKHTVQPGETLFALSRKYEVQVSEIMLWNDLSSYNISVGQVLIVGSGQILDENVSQSVSTGDHGAINPSESFANSKEYLKKENLLSLKYKEDLSSTHYKEMKKTGVAAWITTSSSYPVKNGYYALHKELPVGSVIKVKNLMNNKVVYAKVIGKLPDNQENGKFLIKLPESAAREMNVLDETLIMEVSYLERR